MTFSVRLQNLIDQHNTTAAALAKQVGMSHVAIGNYLKGRVPKYDQAKRLAKYFGITTDQLLGAESHDEYVIREEPASYAIDWRTRALTAEKKIESLKKALSEIMRNL